MADVVEVDDRTKLPRCGEFGFRRVVRGEHDPFSVQATALREHELCGGAAIGAASHALEPLHDDGIRKGFHREVLAEFRSDDRHRPLEALCPLQVRRLVVEEEGGLPVNL